MILLYMVEYRCFRCGYIASQKINMKHHLNRKNICNPILDNISIEDIKIYYGIQNEPKLNPNEPISKEKIEPKLNPNDSQMTPNDSQMTPIDSQNRSKDKYKNKYTCNYCKKILSKNSNLHRHLTICKKKKESENIIIKENEMMKKEIEELKKIKTINTQNNIINNNNTINNININNYGDEDLSFLKSKDFVQLFGGIYGAIPKLIEKIHFNPKYPENHNIKYTNKKLPYLKIRKDNKWQLVNKKHELLDLIDSKCYMLRERYYKILEKNKYNITEFQKSKIEEFMQKYHEEDKKMTLDLIERTELMLLNNS